MRKNEAAIESIGRIQPVPCSYEFMLVLGCNALVHDEHATFATTASYRIRISPHEHGQHATKSAAGSPKMLLSGVHVLLLSL